MRLKSVASTVIYIGFNVIQEISILLIFSNKREIIIISILMSVLFSLMLISLYLISVVL